MARIGLTQRVEVVEEYDERRDCLDQRWAEVIHSFDSTPIPLCNETEDVGAYVSTLELDGIVFTGGNDFTHLEDGVNAAPERDAFERELLEVAIARSIPVLGVCRGLQLINLFSGGSLTRVDDHIAVEHSLEIDSTLSPIKNRLEQLSVNSYHSYGVTEEMLGSNLIPVGQASDGSVEWIEHERYPITGIMWHPERDGPSTDLDRSIISHRLISTDI